MDDLATFLGHERRLLELLLFKLVEGRHLLAAGEARFLPFAAAEIEKAMEHVQEAELRRSLVVSRLALEMNVAEQALTLSALARDSLEPYRTIFADYRQAFLDLVAEIEGTTGQNRRLAARGGQEVAQLLSMVGRGDHWTRISAAPLLGRRFPRFAASTARSERGAMSFSTVWVGVSGLTAGQRALEVAGHNIANVNPEGSTRRPVELQAATPVPGSTAGAATACGALHPQSPTARRGVLDAGEALDALRSRRSRLEDPDLAETIMNLQMAETGYQAVLGAVARLSVPSLSDFLR